jgi:cleavage and polyadenylation specificity factor subunit 1
VQLYVFEIVEVLPSEDRPHDNRRLRMLFSEELKGAVAALCEINGYVAHSMGQKVRREGRFKRQKRVAVADA